jgi:hypothetical protein
MDDLEPEYNPKYPHIDKTIKNMNKKSLNDWWVIKKEICKCGDGKPYLGFKEDNKLICCEKCKEDGMIYLLQYPGNYPKGHPKGHPKGSKNNLKKRNYLYSTKKTHENL